MPGAGTGAGRQPQPPPLPTWSKVQLLRYTTADFRTYSPPLVALALPGDSEGVTSLKSIARDDATGRMVMFTAETTPEAGYQSYASTDHGCSWAMARCDKKKGGCVKHPDKDDLNLIHNNGRFVDMQIFWRENVSASVMRYVLGARRACVPAARASPVLATPRAQPLRHPLPSSLLASSPPPLLPPPSSLLRPRTCRYCDSDPCTQARAVTTKTSADGVNWSHDSALGPILPDDHDPQDLQSTAPG